MKIGERLGLSSWVVPLLKLLVASVPAALGAVAISRYGNWEQGPADPRNWVVLVAAGLCAVATYAFLAWILGRRK
jgi:hypothetical protein